MADALSQKLIEKYVTALTVVESDFLDEIHESSQKDAGYQKLIEQVKEVSHHLSLPIEIRPYLGLSTDATPFLARRYRALTFIALNKKGLPVNWHWKTDTIDAVEPENLISTSNLICSLLHSIPK